MGSCRVCTVRVNGRPVTLGDSAREGDRVERGRDGRPELHLNLRRLGSSWFALVPAGDLEPVDELVGQRTVDEHRHEAFR